MATLTKITKFRRKLRGKKAGRDRKAAQEAKGTTPTFPVHTPEIDAAAPPDQVTTKS